MYRDDDAGLRAQLEELEASLASVAERRTRVEEKLASRTDLLARLRRRRRVPLIAWALCVVVTGAVIWIREWRAAPRIRELEERREQVARETTPSCDEVFRLEAEERALLGEIERELERADVPARVRIVFDAIRTRDARSEHGAREIVAGAACARGEVALFERATKTLPPERAGAMRGLCGPLVEGAK